MTQDELIAVIKKYPSGILRRDINKEYPNPGNILRVLYINRKVIRVLENGNFRYFYNEDFSK